jgi:hypothetical protein
MQPYLSLFFTGRIYSREATFSFVAASLLLHDVVSD